MKSKKELYQIILDEYRVLCKSSIFICNVIEICFLSDLITNEEYKFIMNDFNNNRPSESQHSEFMDMTYNRHSSCWWSMYCDSYKPFDYNVMIRITFLEKMVRIQDAILE
jgi:hypothetical protein